jgi:hypothetical protein
MRKLMPSRVLHDILSQILETSDVHRIENPPIRFGGGSDTFQQMYMQSPQEMLTLRRTITQSEIDILPVNVYSEILQLFESWMSSGNPINVNRRFRQVYLTHIDRAINPNSFEYDIRLEFRVGEYNGDAVDRTREMDNLATQGVRRSAVMSHEFGQPQFHKKAPKVRKRNEKHFDEDLFNI